MSIVAGPSSVKVVIVMPAFNVARTLEKTYWAIPESVRTHIVLGDNQSSDDTIAVAERLGITVLKNDRNYGYGGNLKRLFKYAVDNGAHIVMELHPDYQYEPQVVDMLAEYIKRGYFDVMQGNRMWSRAAAFEGGMHWYRYYGNRLLTLFENVWFGITLGEWHSGMKAFRAEVLKALPLNSYADTHAFASDILMDCVAYGYRVGEIPIPVRYNDESSSVNPLGLFAYTARTVLSAFKRPPWTQKGVGSVKLPPIKTDIDHKNGAADSRG